MFVFNDVNRAEISFKSGATDRAAPGKQEFKSCKRKFEKILIKSFFQRFKIYFEGIRDIFNPINGLFLKRNPKI